jgi:hypothetical protein
MVDRLGYIERWLNSRESWLETCGGKWMNSVMRRGVSRTIRRGGEWTARLRYMMEAHDLSQRAAGISSGSSGCSG